VPLNVYFKNFTGPNEYGAATAFIRKEFLKFAPGKQVHVYKTCATDTNNIRLVFKAVKEHIISANLRRLGLFATPPPQVKPKPRSATSSNLKTTSSTTDVVNTPNEEQKDSKVEEVNDDVDDS